MNKTFQELVENKSSTLFTEFESSPSLCSFIIRGVPLAISAYLQKKMIETRDSKTELTFYYKDSPICTFKLIANKRGDSVAFAPDFEVNTLGYKWISSDSTYFDTELLASLGFDIRERDDEYSFIDCLKHALGGDLFKEGEWIPNQLKGGDNDATGLVFDTDEDVAIIAAEVIAVIFEVLSLIRNDSMIADYTADGFGKFTVTPGKDGWTVRLDFDKDYKNACKYDQLAEEMADSL